jgi:flavin-dependent thymidylate synthase
MNQLRKWADEQQYVAEPMQVDRLSSGAIIPKVHLLTMTEDPLGAMAATMGIYKGNVHRSLSEITDDQRRDALVQMQKTHLQAPLESIHFHFLIEGVTRAFTHQMVRQRMANYDQESLRFAVKEESWKDVVSLPPSLTGTEYSEPMEGDHPSDYFTRDQRNRDTWDEAIRATEAAYKRLVENGVAAEEARGLIPHAMTTRIHYQTNLRALADHAGNRLCTQAQFEWRIVFHGIVNAINYYTPDFSWAYQFADPEYLAIEWADHHRWQFEALATSGLFRPVCYKIGHCPVQADFDRACTIRERVEVRARNGSTDSSQWHKPFLGDKSYMAGGLGPDYKDDGIHTYEWMTDPAAARVVSGGNLD